MTTRCSIFRRFASLVFLAIPAFGSASSTLEFQGDVRLARDPAPVAISPDGRHLYVGDEEDFAITVLSRDPTSGDLSLVERVFSGQDALVPSLFEIQDVEVNGDGANIYVVSSSASTDSITVFARDSADGTLTFTQRLTQGVGGVSGINNARSVAISPDGAHAYVRSSFPDRAIAIFSRDPSTGHLSWVAAVPVSAAGIVLSPNGEHLYAPTGVGVEVYDRDSSTGLLTFVEMEPDTISTSKFSVVMTTDGAHIYVAAQSGEIATFARDDSTGELTLVDVVVAPAGEFLRSPSGLEPSRDGTSLYVPARGGDSLIVYSRDAGTGHLTLVEVREELLDDARYVVVSPDDAHVYVTAAGDESVVHFTRDGTSGALTFDGAFAGFLTRALAVAPDGAHVYGADASKDALLFFERDGASGDLRYVDSVFNGLDGVSDLVEPREIVAAPGGTALYVETVDHVLVFQRDPSSGEIVYVQTAAPSGTVLPSSDGSHVYVLQSASILGFARDPSSEALAPIGDWNLTPAGGSGAISPDGLFLYEMGEAGAEGFVHIFGRDPTTGSLTPLATDPLPLDQVVGGMGFSEDGEFLYGGRLGGVGGLAAYRRDAATGALTLVDVDGNQQHGIDDLGLSDSSAIAVTDANVYAARVPLLVVFGRDPHSGQIGFLDREIVPGAVPAVAASPGGEHVYLGRADDGTTLSIYARDFECAAEPLPSCRTAQRSSLLFRGHPISTRESMRWLWKRGAATTAEEFDPGTENHYAFCVYSEAGPDPELVSSGLALAKEDCNPAEGDRPCWSASAKLFKFKDDYRLPDGVGSLKLRPGVEGKATINLSGLGADVHIPPLPAELPWRVQLQSRSGLCWESSYSTSRRNDGSAFRAKSG